MPPGDGGTWSPGARACPGARALSSASSRFTVARSRPWSLCGRAAAERAARLSLSWDAAAGRFSGEGKSPFTPAHRADLPELLHVVRGEAIHPPLGVPRHVPAVPRGRAGDGDRRRHLWRGLPPLVRVSDGGEDEQAAPRSVRRSPSARVQPLRCPGPVWRTGGCRWDCPSRPPLEASRNRRAGEAAHRPDLDAAAPLLGEAAPWRRAGGLHP